MMWRIFLGVLLVAIAPLAQSDILSEASCNARRLVSRMNGPKPIVNKNTRPFSDSNFEKFCYLYARRVIHKASGHDFNLNEAEGVLETIFTINPESVYSHIGAAELELRRRDLNLSISPLFQTYQEAYTATRINPKLSDSFVTLGRVELLMNCLSCAELQVKKAKELGSTSPELSLLVSSIDEAKGNIVGAKDELIKALSNPSPELTTELIRDIHLKLAYLNALQRDFLAADEEIDKAIAIDPENPLPFIARAEFYLFLMGDEKAAAKAAIKANAVQPTVEASRVLSFSEYFAWAKAYPRRNSKTDIKHIIQTSLVTPEEMFVISAKHEGFSVIAEAMLKAKVINNTETRDGNGNTALIAATIGKNANIVQYLISRHADVNAQNSHGERALSFLILSGNHKATAMILKAGANVNYVDIDGNTPLSLAVFKQDRVVVEQLLARGASIQPVLDLAKRLGIVEIEKLINSLLPIRT